MFITEQAAALAFDHLHTARNRLGLLPRHRHRASSLATRDEKPLDNLTAADDGDSDADAATEAATNAALDAIVAAAPPLPYPVRARLAFLLVKGVTGRWVSPARYFLSPTPT